LFSVLDDDAQEQLEITAIHDERGYRSVRQALADQYNLGSREPNVQIYNVDRRGDRSLTLRHSQYRRRPLGDSTDEVLRHLARLWGFDVRLETVDEDGSTEVTHECRPPR
jgi:spore cortex formation protein SpoVR/YcgB (stage V sporulation)